MSGKDSNLINKAINGHEKSRHRLYTLYYGYCMSVALRYCPSREEAKDLVHDAFVKVFTKLGTFDQKQSFKSWIRRIVINLAIDQFRRLRFQAPEMDVVEDNAGVTDGNILEGIAAGEILEAINNLSPTYRMVFTLYAIDGFKHEEVAHKLGISIGTSKSNLSKARARLQKMLRHSYQKNMKNHG